MTDQTTPPASEPAVPAAAPVEPVAAPEPAPAAPAEPAPAVPAEPTAPAAEAKPEEKPPIVAADYQLKTPENLQVNEAAMGKFTETAAKLGLDNAAAQSMLDLFVEASSANDAAARASFDTLQTEWQTAVKALPEFADAVATEKSQAAIGRLLDDVAGKDADEIRTVMAATGAGNNPAVVKFMLKLANAMTEGMPAPVGKPTGATTGPKSLGEILYPTSTN